MKNNLNKYSATENNEKWENIIKRKKDLNKRKNDIRSDFERDYTRIIHSMAYRRMKHKTQVFFSPENDHISTRIEHITHVESISYTIAKSLGLNTDLTRAIATAHDIGHSPFGHQGENILSEISKRELGETFWHEKNGANIVDKIELLEDSNGYKQNLNLTYGVRDGIISHCGEIDENGLKPRNEFINLDDYKYPNQYAPYTWEGCVVKVADKISYLGRDIKDAISLGILDEPLKKLHKYLNIENEETINNSIIIKDFIYDLCENSSYEKGLCFSDEKYEMLNKLKRFNYEYIYLNDRLKPAVKYFELIINTIFDVLKETYQNRARIRKMYPEIVDEFEKWLSNYRDKERNEKNKNDIIFNTEDEQDYKKAIIYYISGMTDNYAIKTYNNIIKFF